jgi:hypothetical protein
MAADSARYRYGMTAVNTMIVRKAKWLQSYENAVGEDRAASNRVLNSVWRIWMQCGVGGCVY